jgi:hypothetical protein
MVEKALAALQLADNQIIFYATS